MSDDKARDHVEQQGRTADDFLFWFFTRYTIGSVGITWMAGALHLDVWEPFPPWSFLQSQTVALALILVAFFFRR